MAVYLLQEAYNAFQGLSFHIFSRSNHTLICKWITVIKNYSTSKHSYFSTTSEPWELASIQLLTIPLSSDYRCHDIRVHDQFLRTSTEKFPWSSSGINGTVSDHKATSQCMKYAVTPGYVRHCIRNSSKSNITSSIHTAYAVLYVYLTNLLPLTLTLARTVT
jgi:hypothetical protein